MSIFKIGYLKSVFILSCLGFFMGNVSVAINGKEDQGGYFFYLLLLILTLIRVSDIKKISFKVHSCGILPIYFLGFLLSIMSVIYYKLDLFLLAMPLVKFIILYVIFYSVMSLKVIDFHVLLRSMVIMLLVSYALSIILYVFNPTPEFVFYDGGRRFAGLHFELVNFLYSAILMLFIILWKRKYSIVPWLLGLYLLFIITSSNSFFIFLIVIIFSYLVSNFKVKWIKVYSNIFIYTVFALPLLIGFFLNNLEFLQVLEVRDARNFNANESQLFIRLYPWQLSAEHLLNNFFNIPPGIGLTKYFIHDAGFFGGTGIAVIYSDFGIFTPIFFIVLIIFFSKIIKLISILESNNERRMLLSILLLSVTYITIQSGFFNIFSWIMIVLIRQYVFLKNKNEVGL
jgi:hypothetical protein